MPLTGSGAQIVGQMAGFERLEQAAHQRGLAHAAAAHHGQQAAGGVAQEVGDEAVFDVAVLKVAGAMSGGGLMNLLWRAAARRAFRLALAFQGGLGAFFGGAGGGLRVARHGALDGELRLQLARCRAQCAGRRARARNSCSASARRYSSSRTCPAGEDRSSRWRRRPANALSSGPVKSSTVRGPRSTAGQRRAQSARGRWAF